MSRRSKRMSPARDKKVYASSFARTKKVSRGSGVQIGGTRF